MSERPFNKNIQLKQVVIIILVTTMSTIQNAFDDVVSYLPQGSHLDNLVRSAYKSVTDHNLQELNTTFWMLAFNSTSSPKVGSTTYDLDLALDNFLRKVNDEFNLCRTPPPPVQTRSVLFPPGSPHPPRVGVPHHTHTPGDATSTPPSPTLSNPLAPPALVL